MQKTFLFGLIIVANIFLPMEINIDKSHPIEHSNQNYSDVPGHKEIEKRKNKNK